MFNSYICSIIETRPEVKASRPYTSNREKTISKWVNMNEYEEEGDVAMPASALPHQHESAAELEYLESQLSRIDDFQIVAEVFKQLGDTSRVRIFWLLCHCEALPCPITCAL